MSYLMKLLNNTDLLEENTKATHKIVFQRSLLSLVRAAQMQTRLPCVLNDTANGPETSNLYRCGIVSM